MIVTATAKSTSSTRYPISIHEIDARNLQYSFRDESTSPQAQLQANVNQFTVKSRRRRSSIIVEGTMIGGLPVFS